MPIIPIVAFIAGAVLAGPMIQRVVPVTRAVGQAGVGVAGAVLTGTEGVASAIWHSQPQQDVPTA